MFHVFIRHVPCFFQSFLLAICEIFFSQKYCDHLPPAGGEGVLLDQTAWLQPP